MVWFLKKSETALGNRGREISILLFLQIRGIYKLLIRGFVLSPTISRASENYHGVTRVLSRSNQSMSWQLNLYIFN